MDSGQPQLSSVSSFRSCLLAVCRVKTSCVPPIFYRFFFSSRSSSSFWVVWVGNLKLAVPTIGQDLTIEMLSRLL